MHQHQTHTTLTYRYKDQGKPSQKKEYFMYDAIDRLTQVQLNDEISQQISYDQSGLGNITRKTGVTTTDDMVYGGADGVFAIYVDDLTEGQKMHYILKDHLGSCNVIADEQGNKLEELSFDAWGTRRNSNWTTDNVPTSFIFDRGIAGAAYGGYSGYNRAQFYGFNRIFGGSLDDKLDWKVNQEYQNLIDKFGQGCVSDFAVGSNKNFKKYGLYNTEFYEDGDIIYEIESKRHALGVTIEGGPLMGENGFVQFEDNLIFISRRTARLMWEGSIIGMSTLYHEYQHAADYADGTAFLLYLDHGVSYSRNMMEYRAHQVSYNMNGLSRSHEAMRSYYSQLPLITMEPIILDEIPIP